MNCPYCKEDAKGQLEELRREQDKAAAPGNLVVTYLCNTCSRRFRVKVSKDDAGA